MRHLYLKIIIGFTVAAGLLFFLYLSRSYLSFERYAVIRSAREAVFSKLSIFGTFVAEIKKNHTLIDENLSLKDQNKKLLSELALQTELREQNELLKETLKMGPPAGYRLVDAKTYNLEFTPDGHYILINKGLNDGIKKGDIVMSPSKVLIGRVSDVNDNSSKVIMVTDPNTKITIRLLNKEIAGIARGDLDAGLKLDFITQNDEITDQDIVVTSGNDLFPAGLIVGTVSKISTDNSSLFKKVEVKAEFLNINISRIIILSR